MELKRTAVAVFKIIFENLVGTYRVNFLQFKLKF